MTRFNLFVLPHAGGNKYAYKPFADVAPSHVNVILLEYPGRGERLQQATVSDAVSLARLMVSEIRHYLHTPYAVYGHSMGTLIGLLMLREIQQLALPRPKFVFFTGSEGPATRKHEKIRYKLPDPELIEELRSLGGVSQEVLNEPQILEFFLPIIRADFQVIETYEYVPARPMDIPFSIAIGTQENVTVEEARSWQKETRRPVEVMQFHGQHFFIFDHTHRIMKLIAEKVND